MNQETIENIIKNLGKEDFDSVIQVLLEKAFNMRAIDVDGKGDGGSDYRIFSDSAENRTIAIQKTVQDADWFNKALADARKAKNSLGVKRYFFLTSRSRESKILRDLENKISTELLLPATCFGATEIAGMLIESKLLGEFAHAINLQAGINDFIHRPDSREILLHSYFALSDDRNELQHKIYESTLLSVIYRKLISKNSRKELIKKAIELLELGEHKEKAINGRIDALLGQGKLVKIKNEDELCLSTEAKQELSIIDGIYQQEIAQLSTNFSELISKFGGDWDNNFSEKLSILLAKIYVEKQIKNIKNASQAFTLAGLGPSDDNCEGQIMELLIGSGIAHSKCNLAFMELVSISGKSPLVKKLVNSVVYIALEVAVANKASTVLGRANWSQIKIILDASVAIPYLTSNLFFPANGRFSIGSNYSVDLFKKKNCQLRIPLDYINECAAHLVGALNYCENMEQFENTLQYSQNGYVSHYYQLKLAGEKVPETLLKYLCSISPALSRNTNNKYAKIRNVMADIQPLFANYGVEFEEISRVPEAFAHEIQEEYSYALRTLSRKKATNLVQHDVNTLSHMKRDYCEHSNQCICLTWDAVMMSVGRSINNIGWVVSPVEAGDIFQARLKLSDERLMALAHAVAGTIDRSNEIGVKILDRVAALAADKLADWEFRSKIEEYRQEALARISLNSDEFNLEKFCQETDRCLSELGVAVPAKTETEEYLRELDC